MSYYGPSGSSSGGRWDRDTTNNNRNSWQKHENNHGRSWYNHGSDDEYAQSPNHKRSRFDDETGELTATSYGDGRGQGKVFSPTKDSNPHQGKDYPNESISKQDFYNLSREDQILAMVSKLFWSQYVYLYSQIWFLTLRLYHKLSSFAFTSQVSKHEQKRWHN